jgi:hypothetical protein
MDGPEELGLHGRITNIPAKDISAKAYWEKDEYVMQVSGIVRQVKALTEKIELQRDIKLLSSKSELIVKASVYNFGFSEMPFMVLYHMNFGWPLLDDTAELYIGKGEMIPINEAASKNSKIFDNFTKPVSSFDPEVFAHDIKADSEGFCYAALVNRNLDMGNGLGVGLRFLKKNVPYLIQWKNFNFGEYVLGLEPANAFTTGRKSEREAGRLKTIGPKEKKDMEIGINILSGNEEIDNFIKKHIK